MSLSFDASHFSDCIHKESGNIRESLERNRPTIDVSLLDSLPPPAIVPIAASNAEDASVELLSEWCRELEALEDEVGISKVPAVGMSKSMKSLQRSMSVTQLSKPPKSTTHHAEISTQMLLDYCNGFSTDTGLDISLSERVTVMARSACTDLETLSLLMEKVKVEFERQPVIPAQEENPEFSQWLAAVKQVIKNINILEANKNLYALDDECFKENPLRQCLLQLSTQIENEMRIRTK